MRTSALFLCFALALPSTAHAQSEWTQDGHDAQRSGHSPVPPDAPWQFAWTWNGSGDSAGSVSGHKYHQPKSYSPWEARTVMGGDAVYVPAGDLGLYALAAADGKVLWNAKPTAFHATPAYDPTTGRVFAGGEDGKLHAFDAKTGNELGSYAAGAPIRKSVLLAAAAAFVVTSAGELHKIDPVKLTKIWSYAAGSAGQTPAAYSAAKERVVFCTADLQVHAVGAADGKLAWKKKPSPRTPGYPFEFEGGWPVIAEQHGIVFVRMNLGIDLIFGPGDWPTTNAQIRQKLVTEPQWKNLFALDLESGDEKFVPAVGPQGVEDFGDKPNLRVHSFPVVRVLPDGKEVAYQTFRNGDTKDPSWDARWDSHLGEMVLDDTTVPGLAAGDLRFVAFDGGFLHITDENCPLTAAGDVLFFSHWAATSAYRVTDRGPTLGLTGASPIATEKLPPILRANTCDCGDFDPKTHYSTSCALQYDHGGSGCSGRYLGAPGFYSYYGVLDPPTPKRDAYSEGILPRYSYVSRNHMVIEGNSGDLLVLTHSGTVPPDPPPGSGGASSGGSGGGGGASAGSGGATNGGTGTASGGKGSGAAPASGDDSGCGCRTTHEAPGDFAAFVAASVFAFGLRRSRKRLASALTLVALASVACSDDSSSGGGGGAGASSGGAPSGGGASGAGGASGSTSGGTGSGASGGAGGSGALGGQAGSGGLPSGGGGAGTGGAAGTGGGGTGGTAAVIDATTLTNKLMFGYQGWFLCPSDGSAPNRWVHWFKSQNPAASELSVDMWPDTSELGADELFDTNLVIGGKKAQLYSAYNAKTVARHFQWMKDAGIDGVFLQRFLSELSDPAFLAFRDQVTQNVRAGAEAQGRTFVIMYDISGAKPASWVADLQNDWKHLVNDLQVTTSPRYLKHDGKPLLALWGLGFTDRPGTPAEANQIITWFKNGAPANQQVTLMGGVPTYFRTLNNDSKTDPAWAQVYASFDVVSPWSVGRFADAAGADNFAKNLIAPDLAWANGKGVDYMPVVFPGFSWKNLNGGALNQIPRKGGSFWWRQLYNALNAGSTMVYGAMFDEVDEGTAMYKLAAKASDAPDGASFVTLDADGQNLPSDWYLKLAGAGSRMLRKEIALTPAVPITP